MVTLLGLSLSSCHSFRSSRQQRFHFFTFSYPKKNRVGFDNPCAFISLRAARFLRQITNTKCPQQLPELEETHIRDFLPFTRR
ncbi:Protein of unknown function [Pyronema omphalodes CBS 100304]|uniref:Uncharacterized protein n=1 Tax=Pyronema omphalodes (strain CBS 100304) TaxID=1076935 RepID=U4LF57_PYROM|nr:Protein of unknown function [Pyronema omphalodes CBS 100304]